VQVYRLIYTCLLLTVFAQQAESDFVQLTNTWCLFCSCTIVYSVLLSALCGTCWISCDLSVVGVRMVIYTV